MKRIIVFALLFIAEAIVSSAFADNEQGVIKVIQSFHGWAKCNSHTPKWKSCTIELKGNCEPQEIPEDTKTRIFSGANGLYSISDSIKVIMTMRADEMDDNWEKIDSFTINEFYSTHEAGSLCSCGFLGRKSEGFDVTTTVIFDNVIDVSINGNKDNYVIDDDKVSLKFNEHYENGYGYHLEYKGKNDTKWQEVKNQPTIKSGGIVDLSYEDIVGTYENDRDNYLKYTGKQIHFRVSKMLLDGQKYYGNASEVIRFFHKGPSFEILDIRRPWCENDANNGGVGLHIYAKLTEQSKIYEEAIGLNDNYEWRMIKENTSSGQASGGYKPMSIEKLKDKEDIFEISFELDKFEIKDYTQLDNLAFKMQLQVRGDKDSLIQGLAYNTQSFTIPPLEKKTTIVQSDNCLFEVGGTKIHLSSTSETPYVNLKIYGEDEDDYPIAPLPYIVKNGEKDLPQIISIKDDNQCIVPDDLVESETDFIKKRVEAWYNDKKDNDPLKIQTFKYTDSTSFDQEKLDLACYNLDKGFTLVDNNNNTSCIFFTEKNFYNIVKDYSSTQYRDYNRSPLIYKYYFNNSKLQLNSYSNSIKIKHGSNNETTEFYIDNNNLYYKENNGSPVRYDYVTSYNLNYICNDKYNILCTYTEVDKLCLMHLSGANINVYQIANSDLKNDINNKYNIRFGNDNEIFTCEKNSKTINKYVLEYTYVTNSYNASKSTINTLYNVNKFKRDNSYIIYITTEGEKYKQLLSNPNFEDFYKEYDQKKTLITEDFKTEYNNYKTQAINSYKLKNCGYIIKDASLEENVFKYNKENKSITSEKIPVQGNLNIIDADGCKYDVEYTLNALEDFNYEIISKTNPTANNSGEAIINVIPGGGTYYYLNPSLTGNIKYYCEDKEITELMKINENKEITIKGLQWGKNNIRFIAEGNDALYQEITIELFPIFQATEQTCSSKPDGSISFEYITEAALFSGIRYKVEDEYVYSTDNKLNGLSSGKYNIEAQYKSEWISVGEVEVKGDNIFSISKKDDKEEILVSNAAQLEGKGSITISLENAGSSISWEGLGGISPTNTDNKYKFDNIDAGKYNWSVESNGCEISRESIVLKPIVSIAAEFNKDIDIDTVNINITHRAENIDKNEYTIALYEGADKISESTNDIHIVRSLSEKKYKIIVTYNGKETTIKDNILLPNLDGCDAKNDESNSHRCPETPAYVVCSGNCDFIVSQATYSKEEDGNAYYSTNSDVVYVTMERINKTEEENFSLTTKATKTKRVDIDKIIIPKYELSVSPETCFDSMDGSITIIPQDPSFIDDRGSFYINLKGINNNTTNQIKNLGQNCYQVEIKMNGCTSAFATETITVLGPEKELTMKLSAEHPKCKGYSNGTIKINIDGGWYDGGSYIVNNITTNETKTISWEERSEVYNTESISAINVDFINKSAGTYTISVSDGLCELNESIRLNEYTNPSIKGTEIIPVECFGESNGVINITGTQTNEKLNGEDVFITHMKYWGKDSDEPENWEQYSESISELTAGYYYIKLKDNNECETPEELNMIQVTEPDALILTASPIGDGYYTTEKGASNGKVNLTVKGGNAGNKLLYINQKETDKYIIEGQDNKFEEYAAGDYNFYVTDKNSCKSNEVEVTYLEPQEDLGITVETQDAKCKAGIGSIKVTPHGGWAAEDGSNYNIELKNKTTYIVPKDGTANFEGLYKGTYQLKVKDSKGAIKEQIVEVGEPELLDLNLNMAPAQCGDDAVATINITGGTPQYKSKIISATDASEGQEGDKITYSNLSPDKAYTIQTIDGNGCIAEATFAPNDNRLRTEISLQNTAKTTKLIANVTGGEGDYTYTWRNVAIKQPLESTGAETEEVQPGIYELTVKDKSGCTTTVSKSFGTKMKVVELHRESKPNGNDGSATIKSTQNQFNSLRLYAMQQGTINDISCDANGFIRVTGLAGGEYHIEATTPEGTKMYSSFEIKPYEQMEITKLEVRHMTTPDINDGKISINIRGGISPYKVELVDTLETNVENPSVEFNNLWSKTYQIAITDSTENVVTYTAKVERPQQLELKCIENQKPKCYGDTDGQVKLEATGGWGDYQYGDGSIDNLTNNKVFSNLPKSKHTFIVMDKYGTTQTLDVEVLQPDSLRTRVARVDSVTCYGYNNGAIKLNITGGNGGYKTIILGGNENEKETLATDYVEQLYKGNYLLTSTDTKGCASYDTLDIEVPQPDPLTIASYEQRNTTCDEDNGSLKLNVEGGSKPYFYNWQENNINSAELSDLEQDRTYHVTVTDYHNCTTQGTYTIDHSSKPKVSTITTTDVLCYGSADGIAKVDSSNVVYGYPKVSYYLTWPHGHKNVMSVNDLATGEYYVIITDENNCVDSTKFFVNTPKQVVNTLQATRDAHCYSYSDGRIETLTRGGVGEYTYQWLGYENITTSYIDSIPAGTYTIVVKDEHECVDTASYTIGEPDELIVDLGDDVKICPNNTYIFEAGDFTTYNWQKVGNPQILSTTHQLAVSDAGQYNIVVTNAIGCFARDTVELSIGNDALIANFLMSSDAAINDTVVLIELSNMAIDSLRWEYQTANFDNVTPRDTTDYLLYLRPSSEGTQYI